MAKEKDETKKKERKVMDKEKGDKGNGQSKRRDKGNAQRKGREK
jgi:hypothetical protein